MRLSSKATPISPFPCLVRTKATSRLNSLPASEASDIPRNEFHLTAPSPSHLGARSEVDFLGDQDQYQSFSEVIKMNYIKVIHSGNI